MAKGAEAKEYVAAKLAEVFGEDYIGLIDKKYYVCAIECGQKQQVAIAMTCPKTPVDTGATMTVPSASPNWDFEETPVKTVVKPQVEITQEEQQNIAALMARLGL